jgi:hypothetical protein
MEPGVVASLDAHYPTASVLSVPSVVNHPGCRVLFPHPTPEYFPHPLFSRAEARRKKRQLN